MAVAGPPAQPLFNTGRTGLREAADRQANMAGTLGRPALEVVVAEFVTRVPAWCAIAPKAAGTTILKNAP